jgi:hypothetical protein
VSKTGKTTKPKGALARAIAEYYADLKELAHQNVMYEMGTRTAFHNLLAKAGRPHGWTLIPELEKRVNGRTIRRRRWRWRCRGTPPAARLPTRRYGRSTDLRRCGAGVGLPAIYHPA